MVIASRRHATSTPLAAVVAALILGVVESANAGHVGPGATGDVDVKVILDNNNIDAGFATPSFDGGNREQNETSVAISPVEANIVAIAANDVRLARLALAAGGAGSWIGVYVSPDDGVAWFNTMIPGFPADTSRPDPSYPATTNDVLNVYYASSNTSGIAYPVFSHNIRVSDVGHQPNCSFSSFMGDYIELAARFEGVQHVVHMTWADNRDIPPAKCDDPDPNDIFTGALNQNVYADRIVVSP